MYKKKIKQANSQINKLKKKISAQYKRQNNAHSAKRPDKIRRAQIKIKYMRDIVAKRKADVASWKKSIALVRTRTQEEASRLPGSSMAEYKKKVASYDSTLLTLKSKQTSFKSKGGKVSRKMKSSCPGAMI